MTTIPLRFALLLIFSTGLVSAASTDAPIRLSSVENRVTLIELFTSEGCSNCPPADRWLSGLKKHPRLWQDFVPVAFHVDYWDYIGWRDRFASAAYSDRQRQYAREGGVHTVYTPGMLQNGQEWRGWYRGHAPGDDDASAGALTVQIDGDDVSVTYSASDNDHADLFVHVAVLGMGLESRVNAGENNGRTLQHDFVVIGLTSAPLSRVANRYLAELLLPRVDSPSPERAVAAWITAAGRQAPIQSVGGFLGDSPGKTARD